MVSACYLYAIIHTPAKAHEALPGDTLGLYDQPLHLVIQGEVTAVVSAWGNAGQNPNPTANTADVLRHEAVIEAIMAQQPTLPVRFGTILADADQVRQLLATRQATFTADLAHITGRVEMGVRILWEPPPVPVAMAVCAAVPPGRRYLQEKAGRRQQELTIRAQGEALAQEVNQALHSLAVDRRLQILQTQRLLLSAAYLVPQTSVADFHATIKTLRQRHPGLAFLATGPWPAYHFISAQDR